MKKRMQIVALICAFGCIGMTGCGNNRESDAVESKTESQSEIVSETDVPSQTEQIQQSVSETEEATASISVPDETTSTEETQENPVTEPADDEITDISEEGLYVNINGLSDFSELYKSDVDAGIAAVQDEYAEKQSSNCILLEDQLFSISMVPNSGSVVYEGLYQVSDGQICFSYVSCTVENGENTTVFRIDEPMDNRAWKANSEKMLEWNESGTYYVPCQPSPYANDRTPIFGIYPLFIDRNPHEKAEKDVVALEQHGDFLCVETYGFDLKNYSKGGSFSITYNPTKTIQQDAYSRIYVDGLEDSAIEKRMSYFYYSFGQDESAIGTDTTLEFSDGIWEWYNSDGALINSGVYQESSEYPGLIMMSVTESSPALDQDIEKSSFTRSMPLLFYIAEDGEIYYPGFVRVEQQ